MYWVTDWLSGLFIELHTSPLDWWCIPLFIWLLVYAFGFLFGCVLRSIEFEHVRISMIGILQLRRLTLIDFVKYRSVNAWSLRLCRLEVSFCWHFVNGLLWTWTFEGEKFGVWKFKMSMCLESQRLDLEVLEMVFEMRKVGVEELRRVQDGISAE